MQILIKGSITLSIAIFCLVVLPVNFYSQNQQKNKVLLPVRVNGKWGYINERGKIVIEPRFFVAGNFSECLAKVRNDDSWFYYIDESGKTITGKEHYRYADDFSEGLAAVQGESSDDKIGFIDKEGKIVIEPKFDSFTGKPIGNFKDGLAYIYLNGKVGFIDKTGNFVINPIYNYAYSFDENLAVINLSDKYGYIDKFGAIKLSPKFAYASSFKEGLAGFSFDRQKFGFIDKTGKVVIEPRFDWVGGFSEGLAAASVGMAWYGHQKSGGKWGFVDKTGKIVIDIKYEVVNPFSEGLAPIKIDGKWGFIDRTGKIQIEPQFDWAEMFDEGFSRVTIDEKIGYISKTGNYIWKPSK